MAKCELHNCLEREKQDDVNDIFKLRNILYDKISNLTRSNKLQKGESVEITLEIELLKPENSNSVNSLVEVTIIEHNKSNVNVNNTNIQKIPVNLSQKWKKIETPRRNWLQRIISGQNKGDHVMNPTYNTFRVSGNESTIEGGHISHFMEESKCLTQSIKNPRSNFINILPEDIVTSNGEYRKSYKRVSTKNTPRIVLSPRPRNILTATRKPSLVKVISDLFLPSKKAEKKEAVKSVLNALKKEVNNIQEEEKNKKSAKKKPRPPVHNLGKLVSNILVDMIEHSSNEGSEEIKHNSYPVQYQSFFEPVKKTKNKSKKHKRKTNNSKINIPNQVIESLSETCCLGPEGNPSKMEVKTCTSIMNCTVAKNNVGNNEYVSKNEIQNEFSNKVNKLSHKKSAKKRRETRCSEKLKSKNKISNKDSKSVQCNYTVSPKKSLIQWNGESVEVNKDIKKKIEMMIVNELQNLALIEGMECDIKSLPPVGTAVDSTASNISSFLCELDINDPIFSRDKLNVNKFNLNSKIFHYPTLKINRENNELQHETKGAIKKVYDYKEQTKESANQINTLYLNVNDSDVSEKYDIEINKDNTNKSFNDTTLNVTDTNMLDNNEIKVTYLNENINNWSADSKTAVSKSPIPVRQQFKCRRKYFNTFQPHNFKKQMKNKINSEFVKVIESDESNWNNNLHETKVDDENLILQTSNYAETIGSSDTAKTFIYKTSNECESTIEIELNVRDLELILQKAKEKHNSDKILISAKCKHELQNDKKHLEFRGKNSQSYADYVLSSAAKKLKQ